MELFSPWRKPVKILDGMDGDEVRKREILRSASTLRMISPEHDYVSNEREKWKGGSCFIELLEMIPSTLVSHVYMSNFSIFLWNDVGYLSGRYSGRLWDFTARQYLRHSGIREKWSTANALPQSKAFPSNRDKCVVAASHSLPGLRAKL